MHKEKYEPRNLSKDDTSFDAVPLLCSDMIGLHPEPVDMRLPDNNLPSQELGLP